MYNTNDNDNANTTSTTVLPGQWTRHHHDHLMNDTMRTRTRRGAVDTSDVCFFIPFFILLMITIAPNGSEFSQGV